MASPTFSIVIPHYDRSVSDSELARSLRCLSSQTFKDFEVLLFHDGPEQRPLPDPRDFSFPIAVRATETRAGDWGHSLREIGMKAARGKYILNLNADNVLYPRALEVIHSASRAPIEPAPMSEMIDNPDVLVFAIVMRGRCFNGRIGFWRDRKATHRGIISTGIPPLADYIDCLQVVATRSVWERVGWWHDKSEASDGVILPAMIEKFGARYIPAVLGEHW
ncbi:hypothetical protein C7S18_19155 [Ahniella affigens]|uniref:Glycosyltransferase 2-like domain-containing protein n=1 Tax=Ahniella affigens TaxID=2021234 RepID=A0A2P1PWE1_9GAMM|nr:hypothetical protein C7S18_19155 [Ahniella affigens]